MNKNMKKIILPVSLIVISLIFFVGRMVGNDDVDTMVTEESRLATPEGRAEINGVVRSIQGNEVTVANEIRDESMEATEEEKETRQIDRASMTQEEKQAANQAQSTVVETEIVTVMIPVGVPIIKGSGAADGENVVAEMSEIKAGVSISIWMADGEMVVVKLKGV